MVMKHLGRGIERFANEGQLGVRPLLTWHSYLFLSQSFSTAGTHCSSVHGSILVSDVPAIVLSPMQASQ